MKVRNSKVLAVFAALVAISMIATGCGGTKADGGSDKGTVIKIGVGAPLTQGAVSLGQGMKRAAALAVAQANESAEAKELGITFETVDGDDQGDPKTGVTVANTFASDAALVGVMGHLNSGVTIPASKVYNENKIVMVSPAATNPALTQQGFNNIFRVCTIDSVQGPAGAQSAYSEFGLKKAVVVDDSTPYGEGLASEFAKEFAKLGGTVAFTEKTSDKDSDFQALVTKIKDAKVDMVYYGGMYMSGALLSKQLHEAGFTGPIMGGDGLYDAEYINLGGASAEGDYTTCVGLPIADLPKGAEFSSAYKAMYPKDEIAAYDGYSYDAANVIIAAVLKVAKEMGVAKVTTPAGRDAIIAAVAATNTEGVTGAISFDKNGDTTNKAITTYQVEAGVWVPKVVPGK